MSTTIEPNLNGHGPHANGTVTAVSCALAIQGTTNHNNARLARTSDLMSVLRDGEVLA